MSADFLLILLAAAASAHGAWAALKGERRAFTTLPAVLIFLLVGMNATLFVTLTGAGRLLPGLQINPEDQRALRDAFLKTAMPAPDAFFCLFALLAHVLILLPRADRISLLRPLPATVLFVVFFVVLEGRREGDKISYARAFGPSQVAYLTLVPGRGSVGMVISRGDPGGRFLKVVFTHEAESVPRSSRLFWTRDGAGTVLRVNRQHLLAIDEEGGVIGELPTRANEWPREIAAVQPRPARRRLSQARRDVAEFVKTHGGIYVR